MCIDVDPMDGIDPIIDFEWIGTPSNTHVDTYQFGFNHFGEKVSFMSLTFSTEHNFPVAIAFPNLIKTMPKQSGYISHVLTNHNFRRRGLFTAGLQHLINFADEKGLTKLTANVDTKNSASILGFGGVGFYPAYLLRSFSILGKTIQFRKPLD